MSESPQPEYVWDFGRPRRRPGRVWLIVGLSVAAVAIAAVVFLLFIRPWAAADPDPTASPTSSGSPTASPTPDDTPTGTPSPSATPTAGPTTPPPPADPALPVFREKVSPLLRDAETGLTFASESTGQDGIEVTDQLIDDAGRLSEAVAPRSIADEWNSRVDAYATSLQKLRSAYASGASGQPEISAARSALAELDALIG